MSIQHLAPAMTGEHLENEVPTPPPLTPASPPPSPPSEVTPQRDAVPPSPPTVREEIPPLSSPVPAGTPVIESRSTRSGRAPVPAVSPAPVSVEPRRSTRSRRFNTQLEDYVVPSQYLSRNSSAVIQLCTQV